MPRPMSCPHCPQEQCHLLGRANGGRSPQPALLATTLHYGVPLNPISSPHVSSPAVRGTAERGRGPRCVPGEPSITSDAPFPVASTHRPSLAPCPARGDEGVPFLQLRAALGVSAHCPLAATAAPAMPAVPAQPHAHGSASL